jgi:signal transduction histidine kinase
MLEISAALLAAAAPTGAVRSVVQLSSRRLGVPVAGVLPERGGSGWSLVSARGFGEHRTEVVRAVEGVRSSRSGPSTRGSLARRAGRAIGSDRMEAIPAGDAVLLASDLGRDHRAFLSAAGVLLGRCLVTLREIEWARLRNENLDRALAWTAHELLGPLVGVQAALGHVRVDRRGGTSQEWLQRSRDELDELAELVAPLLRWSTGAAPLQKSIVDLFRLADACVTSARRESSGADLVLVGSGEVPVHADARQLRVAVSNVIRNAVAYSPPGSTVTVTVGATDDIGRIRVRDRGPGVPAAERQLIFDPFARGRAGDRARPGSGLGLFIARRIVEAHGGAIGLRAARPGTEFHADLPLADPGRIRSAS